MKAIIIFGLYFLLIGAVLGMATFLMYYHINGWGWLIFISFLLALQTITVKEATSTKDNP